jgi:hypothetical protein
MMKQTKKMITFNAKNTGTVIVKARWSISDWFMNQLWKQHMANYKKQHGKK